MNADAARRLEASAAVVGSAARADALTLLTGSVLESAIKAVRGVAEDTGKGAVGEVTSDILAVRGILSGTFASTEVMLRRLIYQRMTQAINAGFVAEVQAQNEALPEALRITAEDQRGLLANYPVVGNTSVETADHNARSWRFAADGIVGKAVAFGDPGSTPALLLEQARTTSGVVGRAVEEAFVAGQGAARKAIGVALERALG